MTKDGWRTKSEIRMPKSERNPKPEIRHRRTCKCPGGASGFRASEFGILSDFGIRLSDLFSAAQLLFASCQFRQGHLEAQRDYGSQHHPPPEALLQDAGETNSRAHDGTCGPAAFRGAIYLPDFQGSGGVNIDELRLLRRGIDAEDLFDADAVVVGQIVKPGLAGKAPRGTPLFQERARERLSLVAQGDCADGRGDGQLHEANLARLKRCRGGILGAGGLEGEIQERNEGLVDGPGGVLAVESRSEEHTSELQSRGLISYAVF